MKIELQLFFVALGGALGALGRFAISMFALRYLKHSFPMGTLIANVLGCFLIGMMIGSGAHLKHHQIRLGIGVGLLGSLTTFSTFGAETVNHVHNGQWLMAIGNISANLILGLVAVVAGMAMGKKLFN